MKMIRLVVVLFSVINAEVAFAQSALRSADGQCCLNPAGSTLWEAYRDYWYTGVSVNQWEVNGEQATDWQIIAKNFNWVVEKENQKNNNNINHFNNY